MSTQPNAANSVVEIKDRTDQAISSALATAGLEGDDHASVLAKLCALRDYARAEDIGLKELAARSRISTSALSQLFAGVYPGSYTGRAQAIDKFLVDLEKIRIFGGRDDFLPLEITRAWWRMFEQTRYNRRIQIVQSPEQLGKSRAAREYTARNNGGRTNMVTLQPGGSSNPFGVFLRDLAAALRLSIDHRKIIDIRYAVRSALAVCDLLILDEVHLIEHWPDKAVRDLLDYVRIELHADGARGVVLIATNSDLVTLLDTFRRRTRYNLGQLLGRMCNDVRTLDPSDVPYADVEALAHRYWRARKATVNKLYDVVTRPRRGHLGLLLDILNRCWTDSQLDRLPITDEHVLDRVRDTLENLKTRKDLYQ